MNKNIKLFGLGLLGGMVPLFIFFLFNKPTATNHFDTNNSQGTIGIPTNYSGINTVPAEDFISASENSLNSVVHITTEIVTTSFQRDPFQELFHGPGAGGREFQQRGAASGSGVIISTDGYIVTNNHVIDNATTIEVMLNDNRKYTATIIGTDPSTDLAVLKIEEQNLSALPIGNSDDIKIGEWVLAVGNPFNLTSTVTAGIISAKGRNIHLLASRGQKDIVPIESFIQTDAAVNPGNSGGALVNTKGELIGINTAIASQTGSYSGYSFAIPVNLVKKVMHDIINYGIVQRGYLGIQIADITQELQEEKDLKNLSGVYVVGAIENGSAEKAGIEEGDVILKIGTKLVNTVAELQEEVGRRKPGDRLSVTIRDKKGYKEVIEIVLRNKDGNVKLISKKEVQKNVALGATFKELSSKELKELNISEGVKIISISAGKLKSLGLKEKMIITKINNEPIESIQQLTSKLNNKSNKGVLLEVLTESGRKEFVGFGL